MSIVAKTVSRTGLLLLALLALVALPAGAQTSSILSPITTQVAVGGDHTCALTTAGAVLCWGNNTFGQLGNNSPLDSHTPVDVVGLDSGVVAIAAGGYHTCAMTTVGAVKCWGLNDHGQLGDGSSGSFSDVPVAVSNLTGGVAALAAGQYHTCALTTAGAVLCWGDNSNGQLGDDGAAGNFSDVPVAVVDSSDTPIDRVTAIAAGRQHTCALTSAGAVLCWGYNFNGQLGDGLNTPSPVPVAVSNLAGDVALLGAGDDHTCALTTAGAVQCWGLNDYGQLGDGSSGNSSNVPVAVSDLTSGVAAIAAGGKHSCALTTAGALQCWGNNDAGQLGDGSSGNSSNVPVAVSNLTSGVAAIAAGRQHTCALTTAGAAQCWGDNNDGQLGDGSSGNLRDVPVAVSGLGSSVVAFAAGEYHTCALTTEGAVQCWGANFEGQLGTGQTNDSHVPVAVSSLAIGEVAIAAIAASGYHTCALTTMGAVLCWGNNQYGQLGNGSTASRSLVPVAVNNLTSGVAAIAAGGEHTCALTTMGAVLCWGDNSNGQLGDDSSGNIRNVPVAVSGLGVGSGMAAIAAGGGHTCALTTMGAVLCWGNNSNGQLGDGSSTDRHTPVGVSGLGSGVAALAAGAYHTCARTTLGAVQCWGNNSDGQLGDGSINDSDTPVDVSTLTSGVVTIAAGAYHTCVLTSTGAVLCWGYNFNGQLGDGASGNIRDVPVAVSGLGVGSGVAALAAGDDHTCALTMAGALKCWGWNNYGQLGDDSTTDRHTPVPIRAVQSIVFNPPISLGGTGTVVDLAAVATSGNTVTYDTWTPDSCSISGDILTILAAAETLCGVRASEAGGMRTAGGSDAPAPQQLRLIRISDFIFANGFDN